MPTNVLIMIHGITVEPYALNHKQGYDEFIAAIDTAVPGLSGKFNSQVRVEWGHRPPDVTDTMSLRPDQRIMDAENRLAELSAYKNVRNQNVPQNHTLSALSHPLAEVAALITTPIKDRVLLLGITDVFYYLSVDGERNIRSTVYSQVLNALSPHLGDTDVNLHIYSHSLGNTIAHDFLYGLFAPNLQPQELGYYEQAATPQDRDNYLAWRTKAQNGSVKLATWISAASQLPLMAMRSQNLVDILAANGTINPANIGLRQDTVRWVLFYDLIDVLSFPTRALYGGGVGIEEYEVDNGANPETVHSLYSKNRQFGQIAANVINSNM